MVVALLLAWSLAIAQSLPTGQVVPEVKTTADAAQSYALYLPAAYTPARAWPLILAFDPGGRGRVPVERYQAAAEQYGFIVVGSNNSRNYSRDNDTAVVAMANDVLARFRIDERRVYTAGMSGGARVALGTALASTGIAGVIASSAGFPDGVPRKTVPFVIFATAGTEDFNHLELRRLDAMLTTPHLFRVFEGGHTWLSSDLAIEAVEWLDVQAMKAGLMPRDSAKVATIFAKRAAAASRMERPKDEFLAQRAIVDDFSGLADVSAPAARASFLANDPGVVLALKQALDADNHETDVLLGIKALEAKLAAPQDRDKALAELRRTWKELSETAQGEVDSSERRLARRVIGLLGATVTTKDVEYLKVIADYRARR